MALTQCVTLTLNYKSNYTKGQTIPENLGLELSFVIIWWSVAEIWH